MSEEYEDMAIETEQELDINDPAQIQYWTQQWEVSEHDLRMAVANVGTQVAELRVALSR